MKIKYLLLLVCIAGCFAACKKSDSDATFDAQAQLTTDTIAIRKFITANNIPALKDSTGVFYQVIAPGTGSLSYTSSTLISADYEGRLLNGTVFASGTFVSQVISNFIAGWRIGIPYIQKGGKIRLIIPSGYAYANESPSTTIPENSILDFTITLNDAQ